MLVLKYHTEAQRAQRVALAREEEFWGGELTQRRRGLFLGAVGKARTEGAETRRFSMQVLKYHTEAQRAQRPALAREGDCGGLAEARRRDKKWSFAKLLSYGFKKILVFACKNLIGMDINANFVEKNSGGYFRRGYF